MNGGGAVLLRARPVPYRQVLRRHLPWSLLSGGVLFAAWVWPLAKLALHTCIFLRLTGYPCLSCGWTRGFVAMAHGAGWQVLQDCPLVILLYSLTALVFAWNTAALMLGVQLERGRWLSMAGRRGWWLVGLATGLILANWIYRLALGFK